MSDIEQDAIEAGIDEVYRAARPRGNHGKPCRLRFLNRLSEGLFRPEMNKHIHRRECGVEGRAGETPEERHSVRWEDSAKPLLLGAVPNQNNRGIRNVNQFAKSMNLLFGGQATDVSDDSLVVRRDKPPQLFHGIGVSFVWMESVKVNSASPNGHIGDPECLKVLLGERRRREGRGSRIVRVGDESIDERFRQRHPVSLQVARNVSLVDGDRRDCAPVCVRNCLGSEREGTRDMEQVRVDSVQDGHQSGTRDSHSEFDERDAGNDVDGDALKFWTWARRSNNMNVVTTITQMSGDTNHRICYPINLRQK